MALITYAGRFAQVPSAPPTQTNCACAAGAPSKHAVIVSADADATSANRLRVIIASFEKDLSPVATYMIRESGRMTSGEISLRLLQFLARVARTPRLDQQKKHTEMKNLHLKLTGVCLLTDVQRSRAAARQLPTLSSATSPRSAAITLSGTIRPVRGFSDGIPSIAIEKRAVSASTSMRCVLRVSAGSAQI
jgi:hypothetical protein